MDIHEASGIILRTVHEDLEGKILWSDFISKKTVGYNEQAAAELKGVYSRALFILIDEGLCHKEESTGIVRLGHKGIEANGDFRKYFKKKKTTVTLEKLRRILPIVSAIIVILTTIITFLTKNSKKNATNPPAKTTSPAKGKEKEGRR